MEYGGSRNTKSADIPDASNCRKARAASILMIWKPLAIPNDVRFAPITSAAALDDSTKYTIRAPRLRASMPTAPVPAYKSSQVDSANADGSPAHSTLNSVSRSRSDVGRISSPGKDRSVRRRYCPAITLITLRYRRRLPRLRWHLHARAIGETRQAASLQNLIQLFRLSPSGFLLASRLHQTGV